MEIRSRDQKNKTSPYLVSWDELTDEKIRDYDRNFIRAYPVILSFVDLKIVPIPEKIPGAECKTADSSWRCITSYERYLIFFYLKLISRFSEIIF